MTLPSLALGRLVRVGFACAVMAASCLVKFAIAASAGPGGTAAVTQTIFETTAPVSMIAAEPITPIPQPPPANPAQVALGAALFADPRLSHANTLSCRSCHDMASNGADANRFDAAPGQPPLPFNTSTVFNAGLSFRLTWRGTFETFQDQTRYSINASDIMGSSPNEVVAKLAADPAMQQRFRAAYGHAPDAASLLDALATYQSTLVTPGARFDRWLRGETTALTAQELEGYQEFKSFGCISCHQGVNVGGNLMERYGIFHPLTSGRSSVLRVPSLRNIATTAPYFHDGSAPDLRTAVSRMGLAQLDRRLSPDQLDSVVAFLRTLTGTYQGKAVAAAK